MRPRNPALLIVLRDSQASFILGAMAGGFLFSSISMALEATPSPTNPMQAVAGFVGCFFLAFGMAYSAIRIVEFDRDGRLDQLRLSGMAPGRLLASIAAPSLLPWLIAGTIFLVAAASIGGLRDGWWQMSLPFIGGSAAMSCLALATPLTRHRVDLRIVTAGVGAFTALGSMISMNGDDLLMLKPRDWSGLSTLLMLAALVVEALVIAWCVRPLTASVARPRVVHEGASPPAGWVAPLPARLRRGLATSGTAAVALTLFAAVLVILRTYARPNGDDLAAVTALLPLLVGAIHVSGVARTDAESSLFDMLRLSSEPSILAAIRMTLELWLPFLASTAIVLLTAVAFSADSRTSIVAISIALGAALIMLFALLEGWHRAMLMTYIVPVSLLAFILTARGDAMQFGDVIRYLSGAWIGWAIAASVLRHGQGHALSATLQCAIVVALTFISVSAVPGLVTQPTAAFALLVASGWLVKDGQPRRVQALLPLLAFATATITVWASLRLLDAAIMATLPAIALLAGRHVDERLRGYFAPWSLSVRWAAGMLVMLWDSVGYGWTVYWLEIPILTRAARFGVMQLTTAGAIVILVIVGIATHVVATVASRSRQAVIPRP